MNTIRLTQQCVSSALKVSLSLAFLLLTLTWASAQTFNGSTINTAGNSSIPSTGTGGCTVAPQTTGGTFFNNTVAGLAAGAGVASVQINLTHTWDADLGIFLLAPNGQRIELTSGNGGAADNYTNTVFSDGQPSITTGAAPFTGTFSPEGTTATFCTNPGTIATLTNFTQGQNGTWQLVIQDNAGGDSGTMLAWNITFVAQAPPCLLSTPANLTVNAGAGTCAASPVVNLPAQNPASCANGTGTGIRYSVNGGAFVSVGGLPATTNVTFTNLPAGVNTIVWQTYTIANGVTVSTVTQMITVVDTTPPTVTCPGNMTINLDPGACSANVNYLVTGTDNCPFLGPLAQLNTITAGGNGNNANGMVWFDINNLTGSAINVTQIGMNIANATTLNVYRKAGTFAGFQTNAGAWTLVATGNANVGPFSGPFPGNGTITPCNVSFTLLPGVNGIALGMPGSASNYTNGNGTNQTYTDGTITLTAGSTANTAFGAPFTPRVFNGYVKYQTLTTMGNVIQTSGLPSGSDFPIGTTTNCFKVTDTAGNMGTCCFNVTVNEFANPSTTLACNDDVQISLDATCTAVVDASMILEGDVYGCFDDYIVEILQGGVYVPAILGPQHVGQTIQTRVTDPATGNSCWGTIHVEDKLPPTIECRPVTILCGEALPTVPAPQIVGYQNIL
ncbi:MAG: proprotein convertase P-domain-containing protein, partial [Saprospiraceae bacterium]